MIEKPQPRDYDAAYREWVLTLPCVLVDHHVCEGRVEGHHAGRRAMGRKADDRTMVPICSRGHRDYEHASGFFRQMGKLARRDWAERAIAATQQRWERENGR